MPLAAPLLFSGKQGCFFPSRACRHPDLKDDPSPLGRHCLTDYAATMTSAVTTPTDLDRPARSIFRHAASAGPLINLLAAALRKSVIIIAFLVASFLWIAGVHHGFASTPAALEPALGRLLVAMAAIKALLALPVLVVVARHWIQAVPIKGALLPLTGYWALSMGLLSGIGLIGTRQDIAAGALLYHLSFGCLLTLLAIDKRFQNTALVIAWSLTSPKKHRPCFARPQESR